MATLVKLVMVLIALGLGAIFTLRFRSDSRGQPYPSYSPGGALAGALLLVLAFALMPAFGYIPVGHRGVVVGPHGVVTYTDATTGVVTGRVLGEGFYAVTPFLEHVEVMSVRTEAYTTKAEAGSSDMQTVKAEIVINYRLTPNNVWSVFRDLGAQWQPIVFDPAVQEAIKASTAQFNAEDLIRQRPAVATAISQVLEERGRIFGFEMRAVSIVNFDFSPEFNHAIEQKAKATQEAETARRIKEKVRAEQEANILVYQAEATKRKLDLEAQALGQKAQLQFISPQLIQLRYAEAALEMAKKWNGILPVWMTGGNMSQLLQVQPPAAESSGSK